MAVNKYYEILNVQMYNKAKYLHEKDIKFWTNCICTDIEVMGTEFRNFLTEGKGFMILSNNGGKNLKTENIVGKLDAKK